MLNRLSMKRMCGIKNTMALKAKAVGEGETNKEPSPKNKAAPWRLHKGIGSWLSLEISDLFIFIHFVDE